jgi:hypothetical protein
MQTYLRMPAADRIRHFPFGVPDGKVLRLVEFRPELHAAPKNRAYLVESME